MTTQRKSAANTRLAQWGVKCKIEVLFFYQALCCVDSLVFQTPPLRQAAARYKPF